ncbi:unnamed protein product [Cladocopium goreaui]|uniref:Uncharacterized protein n=1 Tax=Cladocopium goreaui TaxID=2562237 RepID=A0A9P1GFU6_9DINO|nr:unnamed protein product [Cladocopium goreaui]|mmetsp:Transcript_34383/g.74258  ORF Transcript_34383/g.74258 Transcript_34383/m.74258 type:complete len:108 (+) Transcript_34383:44-367(+)
MTMNQRRTPLLLLAVFAALSQLTFVAPKDATLPKRAKDVSQDIKTEHQDELERVEALRQDSLEACLLAAEDESQLELCQELSYELNTAEQLLFKRRSDFRYVESDSF